MGNCCKGSKKAESNVAESDLKQAIESRKKLFIWILGGPGSGKGTQCKMLALHFKLAHLSTGDLLRKAVAEDTPLAKDIKATMEKGGLVDTSVVLELLLGAMSEAFENSNGYLIDGYPREVQQGEILTEKIGAPHLIIYLDCPDSILEERLVKRGEESGRADDNLQTIRTRLVTFHDISKLVMDRWKDLVVTIDGSVAPMDVERECIHAIHQVQHKIQKEENEN